ncbi:hypothetical protein FHR81_002489 [Actinoalloteichus hoggarensis]|uniref:Uncharacterized protein n=1 Tax=Actinoalloteichus hoggarensis TaxID=1470176 RepID=A0A221VX23_9PSEU|nr:hypothetical protein [Actinoalloteichus hoggarensis]ASO18092.1 hypothetical protein AHOG_02140 [Actinoalloteichus hoggarensis]MBB5921449.1 hypothetical protein [Actinoalloteichus hoggarensis]
MVKEYRRGTSRFADLVAPVAPVRLAEALLSWLDDSHSAAREAQDLRRRDPRGDWANPHSFGFDRYHYLVGTAETVAEEVPGIEVDQSRQSLFLCTPRTVIYQCRAKGGSPDDPILDDGDVQRNLVLRDDDPAGVHPGLFTRKFAITGGREVILLLWTGSEAGLADAWIGQGTRDTRNRIDWTWVHPLRDVVDGIGSAAPAMFPVGPAQQMLDLPDLDLTPRRDIAGAGRDRPVAGRAEPEAG